jgi:hypothetical protein
LWRKPIATLQTFVGKGVFQQSYIWWHQIVTTMSKIFVAQNNCDNTDNSWKKVYFNIGARGGNKWFSRRTKYLWQVTIATIQTFHGGRAISTKLELVASNNCNPN